MNYWRRPGKILVHFSVLVLAVGWAIHSFKIYLPSLKTEDILETYKSLLELTVTSGSLDVLLILLVWLSTYLAGKRFLEFLGLELQSGAERVSIASAVGIAMLCLLTMFMGVAHLLYRSMAYFVIFCPLIACYQDFSNIVMRRWRTIIADRIRAPITITTVCHAFLMAFMAIVLSVILISALGPEIEFDPLTTFLEAAKMNTIRHRLTALPDLPQSFFPQHITMLFSFGMLLHNEITAKLFQYLMGLLGLLSAYSLSTRFHSRIAGLLASSILVSTPIYIWEMRTAHIDLGLALYGFLSLYAMIRWFIDQREEWFHLSVLFTAFSLGTKYHALFSLAALSTIVFVRNYRAYKSFWSACKPSIRFFCWSSVGMLPWAIYNLVVTRNPFFPFLNHIFLSPYWSDEQTNTGLTQQMASGLRIMYSNWWEVFLLPLHALRHPSQFSGNVGPFYVILLPLVLFIRPIRRESKMILAYAFIVYMFWVFTGQHMRYLLIVLPGLAVISAVATMSGLSIIESGFYRKVATSIVAVGLFILLVLNSPLFEAYGSGPEYGSAPLESLPTSVLLGGETHDSYLKRYLVDYPAVMRLNSLPGSKKVLFWWNTTPLAFYLDGGSAFVFSRFFQDLMGDDAAKMHRVLLENKVTHVIIGNSNRFHPFSNPEKDLIRHYMRKIFVGNSVTVYEVLPATINQDYVSYYFQNHLPEATIHMPSEPQHQIAWDYAGSLEIAQETRFSIWMHPPAEMRFPVLVPENGVLQFATGRKWPPCNSIGTFQVWVEDRESKRQLIFNRDTRAETEIDEIGWHDESVDLSKYAGQSVTMEFKSAAETTGTCNWFLWNEPQIISIVQK